MKKILFMVLLATFSLNCRKVEKPYKVYLRSYVMSYYDIDGIALTVKDGYMRINIYNRVGNHIGSYKDESGLKKEAYDVLCNKHGDTAYDRVVEIIAGFPNIQYPGIDYLSIGVISNADFDPEHPAGSSLGDITVFQSSSVKPFIDNGYVEYSMNKPDYPVNRLISELEPADLVLTGSSGYASYNVFQFIVGYFGNLVFIKSPTISKTHKFTVTMTADDGRVFTASVDMEFE